MKLLLLLGLLIGVLNAESRYALLIGNSDYKHIDVLKDPSKDIQRLKKSLEDLDFVVTIEKNLNSEYLSEAIEQFAKRLSKDKNNIGFLYYSGHGCQLNYQGYLVPTDVDTKNKVKIKHHALSINEMLDTLSMANNRVNMFFLDACRDVPTGARGGTKGLGQPTATPKGALIVYATEAGETADDNSNFIDALIENINKPNQNVKDMADNISNAVADKTGEMQIPVVFYKRLPKVILTKKTSHISERNFPNENGITHKKGLCNKKDNGCPYGLPVISFNNYIDSGGGIGINDERKFLVGQNRTKNTKYTNNIYVSDGDLIQIQGYIHNNARSGLPSATNIKIGINSKERAFKRVSEGIFDTKTAKRQHSIQLFLSSKEAKTIKDDVIITSINKTKIKLFFVRKNNYLKTVGASYKDRYDEDNDGNTSEYLVHARNDYINDTLFFMGFGAPIKPIKSSNKDALFIDFTLYVKEIK